MAIQNPQTNEYLKIIGCDINFLNEYINVKYIIFKDYNQRLKWSSNQLDKYETYYTNSIFVNFTSNNDLKLNRNDMLTLLYLEIKKIFINWEDA